MAEKRAVEFKLNNPYDASRWDALVSSFPNADVYHRSAYVLASSELEPSEPIGLEISIGDTRFLVPTLVRVIAGPSGQSWNDAVSPYGYGGVLCKPSNPQADIVASFLMRLNTWCADLRLACCVLRSHPLLEQDWLLSSGSEMFEVSRNNSTSAINLQEWDHRHQRPEHLSKGRRSDLAFSRRSLRVTWNQPGNQQSIVEQFAVFQGLYEASMLRHGADPFFHFPAAYYQKLSELGKEIGVAIAWLGEQPVGAAVFMAGHTQAHYHLSATDEVGRQHKAATLLVIAGGEWAREKGCKVLHLGGGMRPNDTLEHFKQSFGGAEHKYGSLMLIPDRSRYQAMCEVESPGWPYLSKVEHPVDERVYRSNRSEDEIFPFEVGARGSSGVSVSIRGLESEGIVKAPSETDQRAASTVRDLIIVGGGEHARVLAEAALSRPDLWRLEGFIDSEPCDSFAHMLQIAYLGSDHCLVTRSRREGGCWVVIGVGGVRASDHRAMIVDSLKGLEMLKWAKIVHFAAWVSPTATIEEGAVVMAGAIVNSGALIGPHSVVNTGAIIEHDVRVGAFAMVSPGATIGGGAVIGANSFIGLGASIRDHVTIGAGAMVGMGSVVVKDVPAGQVVAGVPARIVPPKMPSVLKRLNSSFK